MDENNYKIEYRFSPAEFDVIKLRMIGYNDFRHMKSITHTRIYDWHSLHYVVNGKGTLILNKKRYRIGAGDFFLLPPNEPILYYADKDDPWRYYWINFSAKSQFEIEKRIGLDRQNPVRAAKEPEKVCLLFDNLFLGQPSPSKLYYKAMSVVAEILSYEADDLKESSAFEAAHETLVNNAKQIIQLNYTNPDFSVSDIPQMLFISQRYLSQIFKESTGVTPVAYLQSTRINAAAQLLREKEMSITELCRCVGWGDELYFMKQFKKSFFITVKEYRERETKIRKGLK